MCVCVCVLCGLQETLDWLDRNQLAEKEEFEAKTKEIEGVCNPIMMKIYQSGGAGGMPGAGGPGFPGAGAEGAAGGGAAGGPTVRKSTRLDYLDLSQSLSL